MIEILVSILVVTGTFFVLVSAIGLLRLKDVYSRLHAATKAATLGVALVMLAGIFYLTSETGGHGVKLLLTIVFVVLTVPVAAHMIARASYATGIKLWEKSIQDDLEKSGIYREKSECRE